MKKRLSIIVSLFLLVAFSMQALAFASIPVKNIKLNASTISIKALQTYTLKATLNPSNTTQKALTFSTANAKVATVDKTGKIKGIKAGKTVVTVTSTANKKVMAKCNVTVIGAEKTATLKWYVFGVKKPDHDLVITEINKSLIAKINAKLDLKVLDAGTFQDKMRMIIASNENYDLAFTASWRNNFYYNVAIGAFLPLDNLLSENAPLLKKVVGEGVIDVSRVKGKVYAIPNLQILYAQVGWVIQKNLLDKYNFDIKSIKSYFDIEPFLETIKKNEPNLIPAKIDSMGIIGRENKYYEYMGINPYATYKKGDKSLKIYDAYASEYEKNSWKAKKDWYEKGYIRRDIMTVTDDSAYLKANKYAALNSTYKPGLDAETSTKYGIEYVSVPISIPYLYYNSGIATMTAISSNSKNPAKAIKFLEIINSDKELFNKLIFGIEDVHYKKIANEIVEIPSDAKYSFGTSAWMLGNQFNAYYMKGQVPGIWEETDKINKSAEVSVLRGFSYDQTPIQIEIAKLDAIRDEYKNIAYLPDFENKYTEMYQKFKAAGLDKVVAEVQRQVDVWAKANGKK